MINFKTLKEAAWLSTVAYFYDPARILDACKDRYPDWQCHPFFNLDSEGFVLLKGDACKIAFAGTDSGVDALHDMDRRKEKDNPFNGYVHKGLWSFYKKGDVAIGRILSGHNQEINQVSFYGHSAGGALSLFGALSWGLRGCSVNEVVVFGCPPCMSKDVAQQYNNTKLGSVTYRVIDPADPVTVGQFIGYHHAGTPLIMPLDLYSVKQGEWPFRQAVTWRDRLRGWAINAVLGFGVKGSQVIETHYISSYTRKLNVLEGLYS